MRILFAGVIAATFLTGCGRSEPPANQKDRIRLPTEVDLLRIPKPDDPSHYYLCALYANYIGVALSCDWGVAYER